MILLSDRNIRRFWAKVALPNEDGCMLWTGCRGAYGYGRVVLRDTRHGAQRVSLALSVGQPPTPAHEAAHSCRNRHCVAPGHLRWTDRKGQALDKERDGTACRGENHGQATLTAQQVEEIRALYSAGGTTQQQLGLRYGVQQAAISKIVLGQRWTR